MSKNLLIVESPAKARTIKKYLGPDFKIMASVGHVKDLPVKKLGVDVENNFKPEYITIKGKGKVLKALKDAGKGVDNVYLAPDPDREGEAIAWHIANEFKKSKKKMIVESHHFLPVIVLLCTVPLPLAINAAPCFRNLDIFLKNLFIPPLYHE